MLALGVPREVKGAAAQHTAGFKGYLRLAHRGVERVLGLITPRSWKGACVWRVAGIKGCWRSAYRTQPHASHNKMIDHYLKLESLHSAPSEYQKNYSNNLFPSTSPPPHQKTRGVDPVLFHSWGSVCDAGPTMKQHWVNASCLMGPLLLAQKWLKQNLKLKVLDTDCAHSKTWNIPSDSHI